LPYSPSITGPDSTAALQAIDGTARAATFRLSMGASPHNAVTCALDQLPPSQQFGFLGSVFVDASGSAAAVTIAFPDTGASETVPGGAAVWVLAVTGGKRFEISAPFAADTAIIVQAINRVVPPSGVQPIIGSVSVAAGGMLLQPGPVTLTQSVVPVTATDTTLIAANTARKYLALANIGTGLVTLNFGAAATAGSGFPLAAAAVAGGQGGALIFEASAVTQQAIHAICAGGVTSSVAVVEGA
jgi:hypothetical protein